MTVPVRSLAEVPVLSEVVVRLARPEERLLWDGLMDAQHFWDSSAFAGRGLRYVAEWRGKWLRCWAGRRGCSSPAPMADLAQGRLQFRACMCGKQHALPGAARGQGVKNLASRVLG